MDKVVLIQSTVNQVALSIVQSYIDIQEEMSHRKDQSSVSIKVLYGDFHQGGDTNRERRGSQQYQGNHKNLLRRDTYAENRKFGEG